MYAKKKKNLKEVQSRSDSFLFGIILIPNCSPVVSSAWRGFGETSSTDPSGGLEIISEAV